jgi:lipopolysaccharide export LptBFGC system permease protein LptF
VLFLIPSILQRYVLRDALRVAVISVVALTAMMFVGMSVNLMQRGVSVVQLAAIIPYVAAFSLPYALPAAFLLASVFVFGRLSANNEITAIRSSGINLNHVITPLLAVGVLASVFTFTLNHYLLPWSMVRIMEMRQRLITEVVQMVGGTYREYQVGNYLVYAGDIDERAREWRNVAVIEFKAEIPTKVLLARRGRCHVDEARSLAILDLQDGTVLRPRMASGEAQPPVKFETTRFMIDLSEEIDFSVDRPKYLPLGRLLIETKRLKREAADIRMRPEYAGVEHPKTERKLLARERDRAWRDYSRAKNALEDRLDRVASAREAVERAESKARVARAARDSAASRRAEIEDALGRQREYERRLVAERKSLIERNAAPSRVLERQAELRSASARTKELEKTLAASENDLQAAEKELKPIEESLALATTALKALSEEVDALRKSADAVAATYNAVRTHVEELRTMERDLRARSEFHFRNAGALTALVFMLIGIPLGIISRHGNVIMAFVISFFVVLIVYYPLMVVGQMLSIDGYLPPVVGQWMANVVVGGAGTFLLARRIRR